MTDPGGPHLTAALICERVLHEQDGVMSSIRIIDRVFFLTGEDDTPIDPQIPVTLLVSLKSGSGRGSYTIKVEIEKPSTEREQLLEAPVLLEGEDRGANVILGWMFRPDEAGLYWIDVFFDDDRLTRIPLRAVYQSQATVGRGG